MSAVVDAVGRAVTAQVPKSPTRARGLLEAAYTWVNFSGKVKRAQTMEAAIDHFNGSIASTIVHGIRHPEEAVLVNIFLPCELVYALGLTPMFPEGIAVYVACTSCSAVFAELAEQRGVPDSFCSYHKTMIGMVESGVLPKPLLVANTTLACDANQVSFRRVADFTGAPHLVIDVPHDPDEDAVAYVADQLHGLAHTLEELSHRRLDESRLREVMAISRRTRAYLRTYLNGRGNVTLPTTCTGELCNFIATHCLLGHPASERYARTLVEIETAQLEKQMRQRQAERQAAGRKSEASKAEASRAEAGERVPRIFWIHTLPNWQHAMTEVFDCAQACELVGTDVCLGSLYGAAADSRLGASFGQTSEDFSAARLSAEHIDDPADVAGFMERMFLEDADADPYDLMARRIVYNLANGNGRRRIYASREAALHAKADGVVVFCHWGCKQTLGLSALAKEVFEEAGLPTLVLDGDGCDGRSVSDGQMVTRVNAFLEQLRGRIS